MRAFHVPVANGRIFTVIAPCRTEVPSVVDDSGIATRWDIIADAVSFVGNSDERPGVYPINDDEETLR